MERTAATTQIERGLVDDHQDGADLARSSSKTTRKFGSSLGGSLVIDSLTSRRQTAATVVALPTSRLR